MHSFTNSASPLTNAASVLKPIRKEHPHDNTGWDHQNCFFKTHTLYNALKGIPSEDTSCSENVKISETAVWPFRQCLWNRVTFSASHLGPSGCSHIVSVFTDEKQKKAGLMTCCMLPRQPSALFVMLPTWSQQLLMAMFCNFQSPIFSTQSAKTTEKLLCHFYFIPIRDF